MLTLLSRSCFNFQVWSFPCHKYLGGARGSYVVLREGLDPKATQVMPVFIKKDSWVMKT